MPERGSPDYRLKLYRGRFYAVWREDGRTRRAALRTKDRELAERRLADLSKAPAAGTVAEIYRAYLLDLADRGKSADRAGEAWKALARRFAALRPDQVDRKACRLYAKERRLQGRRNGTVAKELGCLRAALRWHDRDTPATVELPPTPPPRDRYLTRAEYAKLRRAAKTPPHLYVFVVLGLATAGRAEALLDLTWDRVDFARGRIHLGGTEGGNGGRKGRATVPMTRHARRTLRWAQRLAVSPYVVEYAGRRIGSVKKAFASATARAGLEGVTPHVLRHTAAVWMAEAGVSMPAIAQYLGHGDDRITQQVYARFSPDYQRQAAAALE